MLPALFPSPALIPGASTSPVEKHISVRDTRTQTCHPHPTDPSPSTYPPTPASSPSGSSCWSSRVFGAVVFGVWVLAVALFAWSGGSIAEILRHSSSQVPLQVTAATLTTPDPPNTTHVHVHVDEPPHHTQTHHHHHSHHSQPPLNAVSFQIRALDPAIMAEPDVAAAIISAHETAQQLAQQPQPQSQAQAQPQPQSRTQSTRHDDSSLMESDSDSDFSTAQTPIPVSMDVGAGYGAVADLTQLQAEAELYRGMYSTNNDIPVEFRYQNPNYAPQQAIDSSQVYGVFGHQPLPAQPQQQSQPRQQAAPFPMPVSRVAPPLVRPPF